MRLLTLPLFAFLMFGTVSTRAQTEEEKWLKVISDANGILFACYERQSIHAINSGVSERQFVKVVVSLCNKQIETFIEAVYSAFRWKGDSHSQARQTAEEYLAKSIRPLPGLYRQFGKPK